MLLIFEILKKGNGGEMFGATPGDDISHRMNSRFALTAPAVCHLIEMSHQITIKSFVYNLYLGVDGFDDLQVNSSEFRHFSLEKGRE